MKKIFNFLFILSLGFVTFYSCTDELSSVTTQETSLSELSTDARFLKIINDNIVIGQNIEDITRVEQMLDIENPTVENLNQMSRLMGFNDHQDYKNHFEGLRTEYEYLERTYGFSDLSGTDLQAIIEDIDPHSIEALKSPPVQLRNACLDRCANIWSACLIEAAAEATAIHLTCATLDWSPAGWVCHGAAVVYQAAKSYQCEQTGMACQDACINRR